MKYYTTGGSPASTTSALDDHDRAVIRAVIAELGEVGLAAAQLPSMDLPEHMTREPIAIEEIPTVEPGIDEQVEPEHEESSDYFNRACWHDAPQAQANEIGAVHDARDIRRQLVRLLMVEAQEDLDGSDETYDILSLARAIEEVNAFIANESFEVRMEAYDKLEHEMGLASGDSPNTVRFRCGECGKFMRLLPLHRRVQTAGGDDMKKTGKVAVSSDLLTQLQTGLAQALAAVQAMAAEGNEDPAAITHNETEMPGAIPADNKTEDGPQNIAKSGDTCPDCGKPMMECGCHGSTAAEGDEDPAAITHDETETPPSIPTKGSDDADTTVAAEGNEDPAAITHDEEEHPPAVPTKDAAAGLTLVMHDSGDGGTPPMLPNIETDNPGSGGGDPNADPNAEKNGPPPFGQKGGEENGEEDQEGAEGFKNPGEHRADEKTARDSSPPKSRAAVNAENVDQVQATLEEEARQAAADFFGHNGGVRQTFNLANEADLDAWYKDLEEKQGALAAYASKHAPTGEGDRAERLRKQKVAVASLDTPGEAPDLDLNNLFVRG